MHKPNTSSKMDSGTFQLRWDDDARSSSMIADTDQIAAENLMYLAQDMMGQMAYSDAAGADAEVECVTEEVITDDWVQPGGQERIEVPVEQLSCPTLELKQEADLDVPLPTDQDEYTAMRPYPCDFCSRRFRKKASLMNHMVAHQNDRPHGCNLCGTRYVRKTDLMNHLKVHAFVPDNDLEFDELLEVKKKKRGRKKRAAPKVEENGDSWENMTSARTQQWSRRTTTVAAPPAPARSPTPPSPSPPAPDTPPPRLVATDPSRPFVCQTCGVGFAREKALQSHSRVHGGESPLECRQCGELCWSRDSLASHTRSRHPHLAAPLEQRDSEPYQPSDTDSYEEELDDYSSEPEERSDWSTRGGRSGGVSGARGEAVQLAPELYCRVCGVAFQRLDLLRRHVIAAHSHKRRAESETVGSDISGTEHTCDVCGETCASSLQLLAHAETHARHTGLKRGSGGSSSGKTFPCRECGKVFGSRSSQQIHVRIHTGERPYGCRFCWKAFADGGTLRKHERIHTGEKPYACAVCPRAFNQRVVLREHVRSHHSAPDHRRSGGATYCCPVCSASLVSSSDLVQHLIEHCDANTALRRQPQSGPRKYKRRRRIKEEDEPEESWPPSPPPQREPSPSPSPPPPPAPRRQKRRPRRPAPPPRPKMIHTEEVTTRPRTKNVRTTTTAQRLPTATFPLMSTEPADDLIAILPQLKKEPVELNVKREAPESDDDGGPYRCEMCSMEFRRRDDLLLHVPVHI